MGVPAGDAKVPPENRPVLKPALVARDEERAERADSVIEDFSIVVGGPVYEFLHRIGLVRQALPNIVRRIAVMVALTWLPLLLLSLKDGLAFGHRVKIPLLYDFSIYARFLIGLPLFVLAEIVIDPGIRRALAQFVRAGIVPESELPEYEEVLSRAQRLRDSAIAELALLALAFFPMFVWEHEWMQGAVSSWHTSAHGLTAAGWWFAAFSTPLMRFIVYRWAFRYFIWSALLLRITRLRLILIPTHPDHAAGINFLSFTQRRFGILFCALGCSFAGRVANSMRFEEAPLANFKLLMIAFLVLSLMVGLLPLALLAPKLAQVRRTGMLEYGRLARVYTQGFDRKWVHPTESPAEPLLGTSDIQSLADLGNSYALIDAMRIAPITKLLVLQLGAQAAIPLIPVIIMGTPTPELVNDVLKMVT
jgi:hypothetical protein